VHTIRKSKKRTGFLAYKIDLVKAYDRVDLEISAENSGGFWLCHVDLLSPYMFIFSWRSYLCSSIEELYLDCGTLSRLPVEVLQFLIHY